MWDTVKYNYICIMGKLRKEDREGEKYVQNRLIIFPKEWKLQTLEIQK